MHLCDLLSSSPGEAKSCKPAIHRQEDRIHPHDVDSCHWSAANRCSEKSGNTGGLRKRGTLSETGPEGKSSFKRRKLQVLRPLTACVHVSFQTAGRGAPPENRRERSCWYHQSGAKGQVEKGGHLVSFSKTSMVESLVMKVFHCFPGRP